MFEIQFRFSLYSLCQKRMKGKTLSTRAMEVYYEYMPEPNLESNKQFVPL